MMTRRMHPLLHALLRLVFAGLQIALYRSGYGSGGWLLLIPVPALAYLAVLWVWLWYQQVTPLPTERAAPSWDAECAARILLHEHLTPEQLDHLRLFDRFLVRSNRGNVWRVYGNAHAVALLTPDATRVIAAYCAYPPGVPVADAVLAQKLMLETDEDAVLAVANRIG